MSVSWKFRRLVSSATADLVLWSLWTLVTLAAILLPIYTGAAFLLVRDCHPSLNISLAEGFASGLDLQSFLKPQAAPPKPPVVVDDNASAVVIEADLEGNVNDQGTFLDSFLSTDLSLRFDNVSVSAPVLPRHLLRSGARLVTGVLEKYEVSDVAAYCRVNDVQGAGLVSLGLGVCGEAVTSTLGEDAASKLSDWVTSLGQQTEAGLADNVARGNISGVIEFLPDLFPSAGLNSDHVTGLQALVAPFTMSELFTLLEAFRNANFTDADLAVLEEVSKTAVTYLGDAEEVLKKIDVNNLPAIVDKLELLEIDLTDFITNPGIFFEFLDDPVKLGVLTDLQDLLPKFKPSDIEAFLQLQEVIDAAQEKYGDPDEPSVMSKLFKIPMDVLLTALPKIKLDDSASAAFDTFKLLMEDEDFEFLSSVLSSLLAPEQQQQLISGCTGQQLRIACNDENHDVCPSGHLFLGLASLAPLLVPGLMYSLTTFLHYQGDIMQCGLGKPFNIPSSKLDRISAWIILLPLYMLFMIPWTLVLIVYRQLIVCVNLLREIGGGHKVEADCDSINNASSFGLLYGAGQGVLHLSLQIIVVVLLLSVGDVLFGLDRDFIMNNGIVCVVSALLSLIILCVSYISSQEGGRLARDLSTPANPLTYMTTSLSWLLTSTIVSSLSTLILSVILYVDSLTLTRPSWLVIPIIILGLVPAIQCFIYCTMVKEGCEHRYAWGVFAAVTPCRFLQSERHAAGMYLFISQLVWFLAHTVAWVSYCVYSIVQDESDTVFRVWLPVIMPLLLISPLVAALHWSLALAPVYSSPHAHPDMADTGRRLASFPPDWKTISGSSVSPEALAKAGYFYSCRRLTGCETTEFSSGRQVQDWASTKTVKQFTEEMSSAENKRNTEMDGEEMTGANVSCFAEFLFIATTLLFRLASFCLLLWVFMDQWTTVSGQLWTLLIIPPLYLLVLILFNTATYFLCLGNSFTTSPLWALASVLLPRPVKCSLAAARQLLVINVSSNTLLHAFLWAAMTGSCSQCSLSVSLSSLSASWPALVVLCAVALLSSFPYYYLTVRNQARDATPQPGRSHTNAAFMVSTAL